MLQLAGGIGLGVYVADLLQLQAAFQGQGIVQIAADEEHILLIGTFLCQRVNGFGVLEDFLHLLRQLLHITHHGRIGFVADSAHNIAEIQAHQIQHGHLRAVSLGGSHSDLRACPGVKHIVRFPGNRRADHIDNGQNACPALLRLAQSGHGIQRFAGLTDDNDQIALADNGIAVTKFRRQANLYRAAQHTLQIILAHHAHMVGRAAGDNIDFADAADFLLRHGQIAQHHTTLLNTGRSRLTNGLGLLKNLLEHEVVIAALFRGVHIPVNMVMLLLHRPHQTVVHTDAAGTQNSHFPVVHVGNITGMTDQRRHIGGNEAAVFTVTQQQRCILAGGNHAVGVVSAYDTQCVSALHRVEHPRHGFKKVLTVGIVIVQQLCHHFRIRFGVEGVTLCHQLSFQLGIVFDDAVVHHGDLAALADMGMGIDIVGLAVGCPTGMADTQYAGQVSPCMGQVTEHLQPAAGFLHAQAVFTAHGNACRVVTAVLQTAQPIEQNRRCLLFPYESNDSTHIIFPPDCFSIKRINTQKFFLSFRSRPLCFAVACIFVGPVTRPEHTGEHPPNVRFSLLLVILPFTQAHGAYDGMTHNLLSLFCDFYMVYAQSIPHIINSPKTGNTCLKGGILHGNCVYPHHYPLSCLNHRFASDRQTANRRAGAHRIGTDLASVRSGLRPHAGFRHPSAQRLGADPDTAVTVHPVQLFQPAQRAIPLTGLR